MGAWVRRVAAWAYTTGKIASRRSIIAKKLIERVLRNVAKHMFTVDFGDILRYSPRLWSGAIHRGGVM